MLSVYGCALWLALSVRYTRCDCDFCLLAKTKKNVKPLKFYWFFCATVSSGQSCSWFACLIYIFNVWLHLMTMYAGVCVCVRCMSNWNKSHTIQWCATVRSIKWVDGKFVTAFNRTGNIYHFLLTNLHEANEEGNHNRTSAAEEKESNEKNFQTITSHLSYHKITVNELPSCVNAEKLLRVLIHTRNCREQNSLFEIEEKLSRNIRKNCFSVTCSMLFVPQCTTMTVSIFVAFKNWKIM